MEPFAMSRPPTDVTDAELAVLQMLWERGPATRRQLADALYPGNSPASLTTVQKLLERLEAKGHVTRAWQEGSLTFAAATDRDELISRRLREVAQKLCGGSLTPLLLNLVREGDLSPEELEELRQLVRAKTQRAHPEGQP
jgi:predicted transcriptional regulator